MRGEIVIRDATGRAVARCSGPDPGGGCPGVLAGAMVRCAGHSIAPENGGRWLPWTVAADETLCPVTLVRALAGSPEAVAPAGVSSRLRT